MVPQVAQAILDGFNRHYRDFRAISAGAKARFEAGDWAAVHAANIERIDSYDQKVAGAVKALEAYADLGDEAHWPAIKQAYVALLLEHQRPELAETFFNSVATRVLHRSYYTNQHIFWRPAVSTEHIEADQPTFRVYNPREHGLRGTVQTIVADLQLACPWEDLERDVLALVRGLGELLPRPREAARGAQVHVLSSLFYRNKGAYLVGRLDTGQMFVPLTVPLLRNSKGELYADALLVGREQMGTLFSLARAYFMVDMEVPAAFVAFLKTLFPHKSKAELYTALGLQKQGKTLFYRDLFDHLKHSTDHFAIAPGVKGMVMTVFHLPSFPYVFKIIRDHFAPPKDIDHQKVKDQYLMVKYHDRVGRMSDTLEYSDVALPLERFEPALLEELDRKVPSQLERDGDRLVIKHCYIERRMEPLDVWLYKADDARLRAGLTEYGNAIRELAGADIFPGDLLLKNWGVTKSGRVVFYDFDELAKVSECHFRRLPQARFADDETRGEPWFFVDPKDIFPEEWPNFLFPSEREREVFQEVHPDLCTPDFWLAKQEQLKRGVEDEIYPYPWARRFQHAHR